jgi:hypothetical protein
MEPFEYKRAAEENLIAVTGQLQIKDNRHRDCNRGAKLLEYFLSKFLRSEQPEPGDQPKRQAHNNGLNCVS